MQIVGKGLGTLKMEGVLKVGIGISPEMGVGTGGQGKF